MKKSSHMMLRDVLSLCNDCLYVRRELKWKKSSKWSNLSKGRAPPSSPKHKEEYACDIEGCSKAQGRMIYAQRKAVAGSSSHTSICCSTARFTPMTRTTEVVTPPVLRASLAP
jgi:hypothetical protein